MEYWDWKFFFGSCLCNVGSEPLISSSRSTIYHYTTRKFFYLFYFARTNFSYWNGNYLKVYSVWNLNLPDFDANYASVYSEILFKQLSKKAVKEKRFRIVLSPTYESFSDKIISEQYVSLISLKPLAKISPGCFLLSLASCHRRRNYGPKNVEAAS